MGKNKAKGEYNDHLDGEKLQDDANPQTRLQPATQNNDPPPPIRPDRKGKSKKTKGKPKKPPLTHFLCLPLVSEESKAQFQDGLDKLKKELERTGLVPIKAVRPLGTLHLTLGVMSLNDTKLEEAKAYLQHLDLRKLLRDINMAKAAEQAAEQGLISENLNAAAFQDTGALTISLTALVPMQSPHKTSILYAEPKDSSQRLYPLGKALKNEFVKGGFLVEDKRALKLHATVLNTIYAKPKGRGGRHAGRWSDEKVGKWGRVTETNGPEHSKVASITGSIDASVHDNAAEPTDDEESTTPLESTATTSKQQQYDGTDGHGPNAKSWLRFDARELIENYKDFSWSENVMIDRVQICKMGAKKIWSGEKEGEGEILGEEYIVVSEKKI